MNKELLSFLLRLEVKKLVKKGVPFEAAVETATEKLKKEAEQAEFSAYCGEHDC